MTRHPSPILPLIKILGARKIQSSFVNSSKNKILGDDLKQNEPEREPHKGEPKDGSTFGGEICPFGGEIFKYIR